MRLKERLNIFKVHFPKQMQHRRIHVFDNRLYLWRYLLAKVLSRQTIIRIRVFLFTQMVWFWVVNSLKCILWGRFVYCHSWTLYSVAKYKSYMYRNLHAEVDGLDLQPEKQLASFQRLTRSLASRGLFFLGGLGGCTSWILRFWIALLTLQVVSYGRSWRPN